MKIVTHLITASLVFASMHAFSMGSKPPADNGVCASPCRIYAGKSYKTTVRKGEALALVLDQRNGRGWSFESYSDELLEQTPEGHPLPENPEWTVIYFTAKEIGSGIIQLKSGEIRSPPDQNDWLSSQISVDIN